MPPPTSPETSPPTTSPPPPLPPSPPLPLPPPSALVAAHAGLYSTLIGSCFLTATRCLLRLVRRSPLCSAAVPCRTLQGGCLPRRHPASVSLMQLRCSLWLSLPCCPTSSSSWLLMMQSLRLLQGQLQHVAAQWARWLRLLSAPRNQPRLLRCARPSPLPPSPTFLRVCCHPCSTTTAGLPAPWTSLPYCRAMFLCLPCRCRRVRFRRCRYSCARHHRRRSFQ